MKRRILALICAATMVVGMGITANAEESATAAEVAAAATQNVSVSGASVKVEGSAVKIETNDGADVKIDLAYDALVATAADVSSKLDTATAPAGAKISNAIVDGTAVAAITTMVAEVAKEVEKAEVKLVEITADEAGTFTLNLGIAADQKVKVFHYDPKKNTIMEVSCTVAGGKVSFDLASYSPVAIVVTTGEAKADDDDDDEEDSAPAASTALPTTSPATAGAFATVALLALVSGSASAVFGRKSKKN